MPAHAVDVALLIVLASCGFTDITRGRIPNAITYPAMALGLAAAAVGPPGVRAAVSGLAAGAAAMLIACMLGATGGGTVKLMAAVGALKGLAFVITAVFYSVLAGGVWAALVLIWSGQTHSVLVDVGRLFLRTSLPGGRTPSHRGGLPFSVAIGVGTLTTLTLEWRARL